MRYVVTSEEDGLPASRVIARHAEGIRLWAQREALRSRDVKIDGVRLTGDRPVRAGETIQAYFPKQAMREAAMLLPEEIPYEDERALILVKPQGLACQNDRDPLAGDTALTRVQRYLAAKNGGAMQPVCLCHRLDIQTGGLLLFAKDEAAYAVLSEAIAGHALRKTYTCLVKGCPARREETLVGYLRKDAASARVSVTDGPRPSAVRIVTQYRVLEAGEVSRLSVELVTGKTHQIRAHLAHIGHPLLGDDKYGDRAFNRAHNARRQALFATTLRFPEELALPELAGKTVMCDCPF